MATILEHTRTGVKFEYINEIKPQFCTITFVNLKNIKTGSIESFVKSTYLYFFTVIETTEIENK